MSKLTHHNSFTQIENEIGKYYRTKKYKFSVFNHTNRQENDQGEYVITHSYRILATNDKLTRVGKHK